MFLTATALIRKVTNVRKKSVRRKTLVFPLNILRKISFLLISMLALIGISCNNEMKNSALILERDTVLKTDSVDISNPVELIGPPKKTIIRDLELTPLSCSDSGHKTQGFLCRIL